MLHLDREAIYFFGAGPYVAAISAHMDGDNIVFSEGTLICGRCSLAVAFDAIADHAIAHLRPREEKRED